MRSLTRISLLSSLALLWVVQSVQAAPITGNGPGGVGDPNVAGSLRLWIRGDVGVQTTGTFVDQWDDQSAYGSDFNQTTLLRRPTYTSFQNGIPVLSFSSPSLQALKAPVAGFPIGGVAGAGVTSFVAYNQNPGANLTYDANGLPFFARSTAFFGMHSNDSGAATFSITAYTVGGAVGTTVNGTPSGSMTEGTWGTVQGIHSGINGINPGLNTITFTDLTVGEDFPGRNLDGQIGEVVFYNTTLNTAQQTLVQNYLSSKFATSLNVAVDRYDGDTGGKGNYDYGVFGVLNVASVSVTNSGMDGFGIEATPGLNQSALAGHKVLNNSILEGVYIGPQLSANTWERSWYVDSDETFGGTIGFNSVDAGLGALDNSEEYFVLFKETEVGDWSVLGEGTISGDLVTLNLASLESGYYTLAFGVNYVPEPNSLLLMLGVLGCGMLRRRRTLKTEERG